MRNIKIKALTLAFIAISAIGSTLMSCHKENHMNQPSSSISSLNNATQTCETLTEEEINSIGALHNVVLDNILSNFDYNTLPNNDMFNLARTSFIQAEYGGASTDFKTAAFDQVYAWKNPSIITGNVATYMNSITAELESNENLSQISDFLMLLKTQVNNDAQMTNKEKQAVKIGISVALHSASYWLPVEYGGNGNGYAHIVAFSQAHGNGTPTLAAARASGGHIAGADAIGGCTGGIGFCIGLAFGPAGVGAYVAALAFGAVSSSLLSWAGV